MGTRKIIQVLKCMPCIEGPLKSSLVLQVVPWALPAVAAMSGPNSEKNNWQGFIIDWVC